MGKGGRRGLVGLFVNVFTTTPRVEGSNPRLSLSFIRSKSEEAFVTRRNVSARSGPQRREWRARERRTEEEERAGVSGKGLREWFGSFRRRLNG